MEIYDNQLCIVVLFLIGLLKEFVDGNGGSSAETTTLGYDNTTITTTAAGDKPLYFCCYRPLYSTFVLGVVLFFPLMILLRYCWMKYRDRSQRRQRSMLMRGLGHQQNQHCCTHNASSPSIYTVESQCNTDTIYGTDIMYGPPPTYDRTSTSYSTEPPPPYDAPPPYSEMKS